MTLKSSKISLKSAQSNKDIGFPAKSGCRVFLLTCEITKLVYGYPLIGGGGAVGRRRRKLSYKIYVFCVFCFFSFFFFIKYIFCVFLFFSFFFLYKKYFFFKNFYLRTVRLEVPPEVPPPRFGGTSNPLVSSELDYQVPAPQAAPQARRRRR